jgi:hypothetical protein
MRRIEEVLCLQQELKNDGVGGAQSAPIADIARHRRDRKSKINDQDG